MQGSVYTATFSAISVSAAQDLFEIVAPADSRIAICEIDIGQYSDAGDSQAEMLSLQIIRGYTTSGSGGAAVTPDNLTPWSRAAGATVERNNTTVAQDGTAAILHATAFNVQAGWFYKPKYDVEFDERFKLEVSTRLVIRITAPADAITMNGTIKFQEIGLF